MARVPRLVYRDYRPIKQGDRGWTPAREKARWMYSPSLPMSSVGATRNPMPRRQFDTLAHGGTEYEERVKGQPKKRYKPRIAKRRISRREPISRERLEGRERRDYLQERYLDRLAIYKGYRQEWDDLTDNEKTEFWTLYHRLMDGRDQPSFRDYQDYYEDYFDMSYSDYDNFEYGETP